MKIIKTNYFKIAYKSVDDQPNFINRDVKEQGSTLFLDSPNDEASIVERWKKKKKKQIQEEMPKGNL
ncbi:MAG: hypothetical protein WDA06_00110 [Phenylobacterium sp.]